MDYRRFCNSQNQYRWGDPDSAIGRKRPQKKSPGAKHPDKFKYDSYADDGVVGERHGERLVRIDE